MVAQAGGTLVATTTGAAVIPAAAGAVAGAGVGAGVGTIGQIVQMSTGNSGPNPTPTGSSSAGPKVSDVIDAGKNASGSPSQRADAMRPVLDQIKQARQAQGWDYARFDNAHGSGFLGGQGEALVVGADGVIYRGKLAGQALIDLTTGAKPPSQIPGLSPVP